MLWGCESPIDESALGSDAAPPSSADIPTPSSVEAGPRSQEGLAAPVESVVVSWSQAAELDPNATSACANSLDGAGTIGDWMRAFWDLHTTSLCSGNGKGPMADLYGDTINASGLTNQNFFAKSAAEIGGVMSSCADEWDDFGCENGIDHDGAIFKGVCL